MLRRSFHAALLVGILLAGGAASADELEVEAALREWSEAPLELGEASAEEIALLPWVSSAEAEAIVTLLRLGKLRRLVDLERIPGFTPEQARAIEPFVQFPPAREANEPATWQWTQQGREDELGSHQATRLRAQDSAWKAGALRGSEGSFSLAYVGLAHQLGDRSFELAAGRLRPRSASPLLLSDPTTRSRSAPLSWTRGGGPRVSPSLSSISQERAISVGGGSAAQRWQFYLDPRGQTKSWAEWRLSGGAGDGSVGVARAAEGPLEYLLQWRRQRPEIDLRLDLAGRPGATRSFAQLRWTRPGQSLGVGFTRSMQVTVNARDPISLSRLDRPHQALQFDLRQAQPGWRLVSMLRRMERAGKASHRWRLWLDPRGISPRSWRWQLRVGLDETLREVEEEAPRSEMDLDLHLSLRQMRPSSSRRLRLWFRGRRGASSRAVALDLRRGRRWEGRATFAAATGSRSLPWAAGLPTGALRVRWLRPGDALLLVSISRHREWEGWRAEFGGWLLVASGPDDPPELEGGWGLRLSSRAGAKVAR